MLPPAPARLSTTTGTPRLSDSFFAIKRAAVSAAPPAAKPTTMVIGFFGNSWATAGPSSASAPSVMAKTSLFMFAPVSIVNQSQLARLAPFYRPFHQRGGTVDAMRELAVRQRHEQRHHHAQVQRQQERERLRIAAKHQQQSRGSGEQQERDETTVHRPLRGIAVQRMAR